MAIAWRNTYERYGVIAKGLHWVVALLVSVQFATAALMAGACPGGGRGPGPGEGLLLGTHRSLGLLLLALTAVRALWRWAAGLPHWPPGLTPWERELSRRADRALYGVLWLLPFSGLLQALGEGAAVSFFGLWELSRLAGAEPALARVSVVGHRLGAWALVAAVTVHLGLVAKQQGVPRDGPVRGRVPTQKKGAPEGAPGAAGTDDPT